MSPLAETQRRFFGALLFPLRGSSRRSTELPPSDQPHESEFLTTADELIRPTPTLIPAECLELYHRQYWFRLIDSLAEDFPALRRLLGDAVFWEIIEACLLAHPSTSYTLRHLGKHMPEFLGKYPLEETLRQRAADVAAIEWALMESFEAADAPAPTPEQVAGGRFSLQAHVHLLEIRTNAADWIDDPSTPWVAAPDGPFHAATWRTASGGVSHRALESGEFAMLTRLRGNPTTLDAWLDASAADIPEPAALTRWFARWQADGFLAKTNFSPS
jgi:hypothetical protein